MFSVAVSPATTSRSWNASLTGNAAIGQRIVPLSPTAIHARSANVISFKSLVVRLLLTLQITPSGDVKIVPLEPTPTKKPPPKKMRRKGMEFVQRAVQVAPRSAEV